MKNKIYKSCFILALAGLPLLTNAALEGFKSIFEGVAYIVGILIPTAFALGVVVFFYGIVKYIWSEGAGKAEGKSILIWGVVAMFVMASVWGIVYFIRSNLGLGDENTITIPTIK